VSRPRHLVKELEAVLREAEEKKWRVTKRNRYFMLWCPCAGKHMKTVHLSPSDPKYQLAQLPQEPDLLGSGGEAVTKFHVTLEAKGDSTFTDEQVDQLADALYELDAADPALADMDITASLAEGDFFIAMTVDADDLAGAMHKAIAAFRTAMHKVGYGTPGWEQAVASMVASANQLVS
jgi:hypothetical protein